MIHLSLADHNLQSSSSSSSSNAGTYQAVETLLVLPYLGPQNDDRLSAEDRRYDENGIEGGRLGAGRSEGGRFAPGCSHGGRAGRSRNRRSRSEPGQSRSGRSEASGNKRLRNSGDSGADGITEHNLVKFVALE